MRHFTDSKGVTHEFPKWISHEEAEAILAIGRHYVNLKETYCENMAGFHIRWIQKISSSIGSVSGQPIAWDLIKVARTLYRERFGNEEERRKRCVLPVTSFNKLPPAINYPNIQEANMKKESILQAGDRIKTLYGDEGVVLGVQMPRSRQGASETLVKVLWLAKHRSLFALTIDENKPYNDNWVCCYQTVNQTFSQRIADKVRCLVGRFLLVFK